MCDPWTGGESGIPDWATQDPELDFDSPFRNNWPDSLDEAIRCLKCRAQVGWSQSRDQKTGQFTCPACGHVRPSRNASSKRRIQVGERDGWVCHRCGLPIDPSLDWPHPLSPVADHHPIARDDGGPPILANLKIAHALCNGHTDRRADGNGYSPRSAQVQISPDQQRLIETILQLPHDRQGHVRARTGSRRKRAPKPGQ